MSVFSFPGIQNFIFKDKIRRFINLNYIVMEHNFDPSTGDYKYILEEERRKRGSELLPEPEKSKVKSGWLDRFQNFILILFFCRTSIIKRYFITTLCFDYSSN